MPATAPKQSIAALDASRPDLLAFEIRAKIEREDIEWMARRVEGAFERFDTVDMLILIPHYEGAELGAVFDAEALKAQMRSARHVRRYAVVGAPAWASAMINLFAPLSPVEAKTFGVEQTAAAWRWAGGAPSSFGQESG